MWLQPKKSIKCKEEGERLAYEIKTKTDKQTIHFFFKQLLKHIAVHAVWASCKRPRGLDRVWRGPSLGIRPGKLQTIEVYTHIMLGTNIWKKKDFAKFPVSRPGGDSLVFSVAHSVVGFIMGSSSALRFARSPTKHFFWSVFWPLRAMISLWTE